MANINTCRYRRTDLACESPVDIKHLSGTEYETYSRDGFEVTRLAITEKQAAKKIGRPCGRYITVQGAPIISADGDSISALSCLLSDELRRLAQTVCRKRVDGDFRVLLAGLGNAAITADAVGPLTVKKITVTSHMKNYDRRIFNIMNCCEISAIAPGVVGQTGIETAALVKCAAANADADIVVAVDALVAGSVDRLACTVQLSDTGIEPGSGIGNCRTSVSAETVGVPVIAIGVPTVVSSATLVWDTLTRAGSDTDGISAEVRRILETGKSFFVSPKESDTVSERMSDVIASAFDCAFGVGAVSDENESV